MIDAPTPYLPERRAGDKYAQSHCRRYERHKWKDYHGQRYAYPIRVRDGWVNGYKLSPQQMSEQMEREGNPNYLTEVESSVVSHAREILSQTTETFTILDYGGMESKSLQVIAKHLQPFIEAGRLVCMSTSLSPNFVESVEGQVDSHGNPLVQAFVGDVEDMDKVGQIALRDRRVVPLKNALAIITDNAISHSHIPDVVLPQLAKYLSPRGIFIIGNSHDDPMHPTQDDHLNEGRYGEARRLGWEYGLTALENAVGLELTTKPTNIYNYLIFAAPHTLS